MFIINTDGTDPYYFGTTNLLCMLREKREAPRRAQWEISHRFLYYQGYYFDFLGKFLCLFFCLFVGEFSSHSRMCHSYGGTTNTGEQYSWPLSSEGSLACQIYNNGDMRFVLVISEERTWHSHLLPSVYKGSCHYLFERLRCVARSGINHATAAVSFKF